MPTPALLAVKLNPTMPLSLQVTSGATDDLRQATDMARHMVMQCGLSDAVGPIYVEDEKHLGEELKQQIDKGGQRGSVVGGCGRRLVHACGGGAGRGKGKGEVVPATPQPFMLPPCLG